MASGAWSIPVLLVGAGVIAVGGERAFVLILRLRGDGRTFVAHLQKVVMADNLEGALRLCQAEPHTALSRVARAALTRAPRGDAEVIRAIDEARLAVAVELHRREGVLLGLGLLSMCLGLLGTTVRLSATLRSAPLLQTGQHLPLTALADDLGCAALGLLVAAVALAAHVLLGGVRGGIARDLELYTVKLRHLLLAPRGLEPGALQDVAR